MSAPETPGPQMVEPPSSWTIAAVQGPMGGRVVITITTIYGPLTFPIEPANAREIAGHIVTKAGEAATGLVIAGPAPVGPFPRPQPMNGRYMPPKRHQGL